MGVATGALPQWGTPAGSAVLEAAKRKCNDRLATCIQIVLKLSAFPLHLTREGSHPSGHDVAAPIHAPMIVHTYSCIGCGCGRAGPHVQHDLQDGGAPG